ncbi:MAG: hypothetical protein KGL53_12710, partial [Elusimicrobia bacterium]|nr:hypothetical protein [Elusimicrobiota bacterium]
MSGISQSMGMVGLDADTRKMALETIKEYGEKNLKHDRLIHLDTANEAPEDVIKDLYDPEKVAVNLLMIPEKYGG